MFFLIVEVSATISEKRYEDKVRIHETLVTKVY